MSFYSSTAGGIMLSVQVQPRASKDEVVGPQGNALKVRVTAPPVDGEANEQVRRFLSKVLGVSRSQVILQQGTRSKHKVFLITGLAADNLKELLSRSTKKR